MTTTEKIARLRELVGALLRTLPMLHQLAARPVFELFFEVLDELVREIPPRRE